MRAWNPRTLLLAATLGCAAGPSDTGDTDIVDSEVVDTDTDVVDTDTDVVDTDTDVVDTDPCDSDVTGPPPCVSDDECVAAYGAGWVCDLDHVPDPDCGLVVPICVPGP